MLFYVLIDFPSMIFLAISYKRTVGRDSIYPSLYPMPSKENFPSFQRESLHLFRPIRSLSKNF